MVSLRCPVRNFLPEPSRPVSKCHHILLSTVRALLVQRGRLRRRPPRGTSLPQLRSPLPQQEYRRWTVRRRQHRRQGYLSLTALPLLRLSHPRLRLVRTTTRLGHLIRRYLSRRRTRHRRRSTTLRLSIATLMTRIRIMSRKVLRAVPPTQISCSALTIRSVSAELLGGGLFVLMESLRLLASRTSGSAC